MVDYVAETVNAINAEDILLGIIGIFLAIVAVYGGDNDGG